MITVNEIKKKSDNIFEDYLKSIVNNEVFFPKVIRSNKSISSDFNEMRKELSQIIDYSKDRRGFGYTISYKQVNTRQHGTQSIPDEISFLSATDYLKFIKKEKEVRIFCEDIELILNEFPDLKDWLIKCPFKVIDNQSIWNDLLKVCKYFKYNPTPYLYIRELPIQVHTKFIEQNKGVIKELLDILISDFVNVQESNFEKRFNLKYPEPLIRFKILDSKVSLSNFNGLNDLCVPVSQFAELDIPIRNVLVVENKTNLLTVALTLPQLDSSIVIFGSGYKVENLKNIEWLKSKCIFYWGDLDVHGFEILSQFRGYFPSVTSLLMDRITFEHFYENEKGVNSKITTDLNLTNEEYELYNLLKQTNSRLEQEKIPFEYTNKIILDRVK